MNAVERTKAICKEKDIPIMRLEKDCGFSNGYIRRLSKGTLPDDRLRVIANYLGVTPEFLSTGKDSPKESTSGRKYYFSDETAEMAQELFENHDTRMLFDAARNSRPEDIKMAAEMLLRFKETNPDG